MSNKLWKPPQKFQAVRSQQKPVRDWTAFKQPALWVSIISLLVSAMSWRQSSRAYDFNYITNTPQFSNTIELLEAPAPGKPLRVKIVVTNDGKSTARSFQSTIAMSFSSADLDFSPVFPTQPVKSQASDVNSGKSLTIINGPAFNLQHDHDIEAVENGRYRIYVFGRSKFLDVTGGEHEYHFCRYYKAPFFSEEPLKLALCNSYNETL